MIISDEMKCHLQIAICISSPLIPISSQTTVQHSKLSRVHQQVNTEWLEVTIESVRLADKYIEEKVVGQTSHSDCVHIATATLNHADVLVSWNFKHIVNHLRIRGYNAVNFKFGHKILDIRSPREILEYED